MAEQGLTLFYSEHLRVHDAAVAPKRTVISAA